MTDQKDPDAKKAYDRPLIRRHAVGQAAKGGTPSLIKVQKDIDGLAIEALAAEHGSPLFVFSESRLRRAATELREALSSRLGPVRLAWSYKTNWLRAVCAVFHSEGSLAEVVSEYEYQKARGLGVPGPEVIYNGPYKPEAALAEAFREGAQVNLDSYDEMVSAERVAARLGLRPRVGLRVNLEAGAYPSWPRFGFNFESGEADMAAERLVRGGRLELAGLHCHIGTFILDPHCFFEQARKMADLCRRLTRDLGLELAWLNLGGGFASKNTLLHQYLPGETATPSYDEYATALAGGFQAAGWGPGDSPPLIFETGRALVDEAGYLVSTVQAVKRLPSGIRAVVIDAGVNVVITAFWYRHEVRPTQNYEGELEPTVVYGPLCMNIDLVRETVNLPGVRAGDRLVIWPVGAYNVTQWLQFIRLRPRVVMIGLDKQVEVIRTEDDLSEVIAKEPLPDRLTPPSGPDQGPTNGTPS
jgi:diaminopimelate decarboxylase